MKIGQRERGGRNRDKTRSHAGDRRFFNQIKVHIGKSNPISNFIRTFRLTACFPFRISHFPTSSCISQPVWSAKVDVLQLLLIKSVPRNEIVIRIHVGRPHFKASLSAQPAFPKDSVNFNKNRWCCKKCTGKEWKQERGLKNALNFIAHLLPDKWKSWEEWGLHLPGNSAIISGWLHKFKDLIWQKL